MDEDDFSNCPCWTLHKSQNYTELTKLLGPAILPILRPWDLKLTKLAAPPGVTNSGPVFETQAPI